MMLRGACTFCNAICCKTFTITVSVFDVLRISHYTGRDPWDFSEWIKPRILNLSSEIIETKEGMYVWALKSHPCIFLKGNACSIYSFAPMSCRLYPHNIKGEVVSYPICPLISKTLFKINFKQSESLRKRAEEETYLYRQLLSELKALNLPLNEAKEWMLSKGKVLLDKLAEKYGKV